MKEVKPGRTYTKTIRLGKGTYGTVWKAKDEKDREIYALKEFNSPKEEEGIPSTAIREIYLLKELNHVNIERLIDVLHFPKNLSLVFEFIDTDLKKKIEAKKNVGLSPVEIKSYLYQLLQGVAYMHKCKIIHRDLKPGNLLITKDDVLKLADFGLARGYGLPIRDYTYQVVTLWYRSPDVLLGNQNYATSIDMWSIGCIFEEMANGSQLFKSMDELGELKKIFYYLGTPNEEVYPGLEDLPLWETYRDEIGEHKGVDFKSQMKNLDEKGFDLLMKFLQIDPEKRISAEEALKHPYFDDIDAKTLAIYTNENNDEE